MSIFSMLQWPTYVAGLTHEAFDEDLSRPEDRNLAKLWPTLGPILVQTCGWNWSIALVQTLPNPQALRMTHSRASP